MAIEDSIAVSVNVSLKLCITGNEIIKAFQSGTFSTKYAPNIGILFTEIHTSRLAELFVTHNISLKKTQKLYESLPSFYHSRPMEKFLYEDLGKTT
jgi:hypothetical protein